MATGFAAAAPYIASAVGGVLSSIMGHSEANDSSALQYKYQTKLNKQNYGYNVKLINMQNAFNEAMMDKANNWNLERWNESVNLANTSHQREVADLRAAGLNPVLSANGGAATVNPIQSAQTSSGNSQLSSSAGLPDVDYLSAMNNALGMYNSMRTTSSQLKNDVANRKSIEGHLNIDKDNSAAQIRKIDQEIDYSKAKVANETKVANATARNLEAQADNARANSARAYQDVATSRSYQNKLDNEVKHYGVQRGISLGKLGTIGVTTHPNEPPIFEKQVEYSNEKINGKTYRVKNINFRKKR